MKQKKTGWDLLVIESMKWAKEFKDNYVFSPLPQRPPFDPERDNKIRPFVDRQIIKRTLKELDENYYN